MFVFFIGLIFTIIMSCTSKENVVKDITIDDLQLVLKANETILKCFRIYS